jgi:hypothetical protein
VDRSPRDDPVQIPRGATNIGSWNRCEIRYDQVEVVSGSLFDG